MNLLVPLGLLGLLGIIALVVIYLIKPNYQQKVVSGTYVWKLSLKYRKKRLPVGRIRNLLIFVCQVAVITSLAMVLANPVTPGAQTANSSEKVLIVDGSANMHAEYDGQTRFMRAAELALATAEKTFETDQGKVTLIVAGKEATLYGVRRADVNNKDGVLQALRSLSDNDCSYTDGDVSGAMEYAQGILEENPLADVVLYTATTYHDAGSVSVVDVSAEGEWNAAILDVNKKYVDNVYTFDVDVAVYGKEMILPTYCIVNGVNGNKDKTVTLFAEAKCTANQTATVTFASLGTDESPEIYSYTSVQFRIEADDALTDDNVYYLYDGVKPQIKFQYSSNDPNKFWPSAMESLRNALRNNWDFADPEEVYTDGSQGDVKPATEGYDFYIFEGEMPETLPRYGTILLVNPQSVPSDAGFRLGTLTPYGQTLKAGETHPITNLVDPDEIKVNLYSRITSYDAYQTLLYCGDDPALLFKTQRDSTADRHIAILTFSPNFSDLTLTVSFASMFYNLFNYTLPTAVTDEKDNYECVFLTEQTVNVRARGNDLKITGPDGYSQTEQTFEGSLDRPGTYIVTQNILPEGTETTRFFVRISAEQSNIFPTVQQIEGNPSRKEVDKNDYDWLMWIALAAVALLVCEWALQAKENF